MDTLIGSEMTIGHRRPDEAELVRRAKKRDESAWAALYDSYYPLVFKYVLAHVGLREDAEDLSSQVFLEALKAIDSYAVRGRPVLGWLNGIARTVIARRIRQRTKERRDKGELNHQSASVGMSEMVIERLDLAQALTKLTVDQQEVIVLRFFLLMSIKETAEILGKSEGAVPVLQVRAIAALRRHLSAGSLKRIVSPSEGTA